MYKFIYKHICRYPYIQYRVCADLKVKLVAIEVRTRSVYCSDQCVSANK